MNNDLEQFSVEELAEIISDCIGDIYNAPTSDETTVGTRVLLSLARIALAAKRSELVKPPSSPMQPLHIDQFGTIRFKANPIVQHLLDVAGNIGVNMNTIAMEGFEPEDQMQFAQLIGYSLSRYGELSYVTDESLEIACDAAPAPEEL